MVIYQSMGPFLQQQQDKVSILSARLVDHKAFNYKSKSVLVSSSK